MKNIKLIEVPSEIGAGTRGASLGIEAIKIAALDFMSNFFIHFPSKVFALPIFFCGAVCAKRIRKADAKLDAD